MTGWTPLFQQIVASSIWGAPQHIRIAWITILATTNKDGICPATTGGLQRLANISMEEAVNAVSVLSAPDPESLSSEFEGRRIERVDLGFRVLNFGKYRDMAKKSIIREQNRIAQQTKRDKAKETDELFKDRDLNDEAIQVINRINKLSGSKFRFVETSLTPIISRLKEDDVTFDGVITMLERKWKAWENDVNGSGKPMREYFTIDTLFAKSNFNKYYAVRDQPITKVDKNGKPHGEFSHAVNPDGTRMKLEFNPANNKFIK